MGSGPDTISRKGSARQSCVSDLANRGDQRWAASLYGQVLGADVSGAFTSLDPGILGEKTLHNLALSLLSLGDWPGARDAWERALAEGGRPETAMALMEGALEAGDLGAVRRALAWAEWAEGGRGGLWQAMWARCAEQMGLP